MIGIFRKNSWWVPLRAKQTIKETNKQTNKQANKQRDGQTKKQTNQPTNKQTDKQTIKTIEWINEQIWMASLLRACNEPASPDSLFFFIQTCLDIHLDTYLLKNLLKNQAVIRGSKLMTVTSTRGISLCTLPIRQLVVHHHESVLKGKPQLKPFQAHSTLFKITTLKIKHIPI